MSKASLEEPYVLHSVRPAHTPKTRLLKEGTSSSIATLTGIDMRKLRSVPVEKVTRLKPMGLLPHAEKASHSHCRQPGSAGYLPRSEWLSTHGASCASACLRLDRTGLHRCQEKINEKIAPLVSSPARTVIGGIRPSALHYQVRSRTHPGSVPQDGGEQGPRLLSPSAS